MGSPVLLNVVEISAPVDGHLAGDLQVTVLQGLLQGLVLGRQGPVTLQQQGLDRRRVEAQELLQPAAEAGVGLAGRQAEAQYQLGARACRQPGIVGHPAIHGEQAEGQPPGIEADAQQMGELGAGLSGHEQMQMAVLIARAVAVVIGLAAAGRVAPIVLGIVALSKHHHVAGADAHQRPMPLVHPEPVAQAAATGLVALAQEHQRAAQQPAGLAAPHPPGLAAQHPPGLAAPQPPDRWSCFLLPQQPPRGPQPAA